MGQREYSRADRVGDQIQRELAELLLREVNDPRARGVTLSGVKVSRDLAHATVYVTPAADSDADEVLPALNRASGFLRRQLAGRIRFRHVPSLRFQYDPTLDRALRVESLLRDEGSAGRIDPDEREDDGA